MISSIFAPTNGTVDLTSNSTRQTLPSADGSNDSRPSAEASAPWKVTFTDAVRAPLSSAGLHCCFVDDHRVAQNFFATEGTGGQGSWETSTTTSEPTFSTLIVGSEPPVPETWTAVNPVSEYACNYPDGGVVFHLRAIFFDMAGLLVPITRGLSSRPCFVPGASRNRPPPA